MTKQKIIYGLYKKNDNGIGYSHYFSGSVKKFASFNNGLIPDVKLWTNLAKLLEYTTTNEYIDGDDRFENPTWVVKQEILEYDSEEFSVITTKSEITLKDLQKAYFS